ncbi:hypothetical protein GGR51DRAFT_567102 [Nemania sp. FL0031]|nr:hypothetical protein GGR51DRAFT_567102 [Nemania sp. FL0031]
MWSHIAFIWALLMLQISTSSPAVRLASSTILTNSSTSTITNINTTVSNSNSNTSSVALPEWLEAVDPCSGSNTAAFEFGKEYDEAECPAINSFLPDGECDWAMKQSEQTKCGCFCQVRTTFYPAEEVPIPNTYCRGPRRCSIPAGRTLQVVAWWSGSDAAASALKHGVSGGFDPTQQLVAAGAGDVTIGEGECGYFTWIGTRKEVCGSLTLANRHDPPPGGLPYCQGPATTTANYCANETYGGPLRDVSQFGHTVFVRIDCDSRVALPADAQDPLFQYDGVALGADRLDQVLQDWVTTTCTVKDDFLYATFSMRGRGLRDADLGASGIHLLEHMRACRAAVTGWTFDYTPDDNEFDWRATGTVDPFDIRCPGDALLAVGADYRDGC